MLMVSDIQTKILSGPDEDGEITFAIKVSVTNRFDDADVFLDVQGLDADGFERASVSLEGHILPGQTKVLSTKQEYFARAEYDAIVEWRYQ